MQFRRTRQFGKLALGAAVALMVGCSGSQQDDEQLDSQYGGQYENQQGNGYNEYEDEGNGEGNGEEYTNYNAEDGEAYNSDVANDTDEYADVPVENTATNTVDATLTGAEYDTGAAGDAPPPDYGQTVATPAAGGASAPVPGGRGRYVVQGGAQIIDANGSSVGSLQQGEHPVTWEENGMYRITSGQYLSPESVSDQGVPRPMSGGYWQ